MRSVSALLVFASCVWLTASAQEPKAQPKPADKAPAKAEKELVPGRKLKKIEGFTFLLSEEAANADPSKYERPPLEVLEYECKTLTKMLSPKTVELLRRLTIWVEWDNKVPMSNGRDGFATASYYSGSAQQIVRDGKHPLQAKTVTIHTLKTLTESCQPKDDKRNSCLLLHEFAHAVHDQLLGFEHGGVRAAYEQAMERRLYEKDFYAATNPREFFAELSCAYLDRLQYFPHNRDELQKHDPVTYKTMQTIWAGATASKAAKIPPAHAENTSLKVSLPGDVKFGETLSGSKPEVDKLAGKVVLIGYWGGLHANVLTRFDRLQTELEEYGLVVICPFPYVRNNEAIKGEVEKRGAKVAVTRAAFVKEDEGTEYKGQLGGHALLFDANGKCVYRGSAYSVEDPVRAAIGKQLMATALGSDEVPKAFKPVADAIAAGGTPVSLIAKLTPLTNSTDADTKSQAKKLYDLILAPGQTALADAQASAKSDPLGAFLAAEKVAARFKNTPLAAKATTLVASLRMDKAVGPELKARTQLAEIEKLTTKLRGQEGSFSPSDPLFQSKNQQLLTLLKTSIEKMRKQYPTARATVEAESIAREFAIQ